jgi:hypothetical protein
MRIHRNHFISVGIAAAAALLLAACAQLPSDAKVKAFGQATEAAADILKRTIDVHLELAQRLGEESAAVAYIGGKKDFKFPPVNWATIDKEALAPRRQLVDAIGAYGKALVAASDKGTIDQLEASVITLASTVGTAVAPLVGGASVPLISPTAKIVGRGIGLAAANAYATEIYAVISRTDPVIRKAAYELEISIREIDRNNRSKFKKWESAKRAVLATIVEGPNISRSITYADYKAAVAEARSIDAKLTALAAYKKVLDAMVKAHAGLASPDTDATASLAKFIEITKEVTGYIEAIKSLEQKK